MSRSNLTKEVKFRCRPTDIFAALTDHRMLQAFTQSPATSDVKVGGAFTLWGGSLQGEYLELVPDAKIVESWRFVDWADGVSSKVTITLSSPSYGITVLKLTQTGIPEEDRFGHRGVVAKVDDGWDSKFFRPITKVLGFAFCSDDDSD